MAIQHYNYPWSGGHDRSAAPLAANPGSFYRLHNLRQNPDSPGKVEQTYPFYVHDTIPRGTYYPATLEPATSSVRQVVKPAGLTTGLIAFTDYTIYNTEVPEQVPVLYFIYSPTAGPLPPRQNQQAYIIFNSSFPTVINLGSSFEIEVTGTDEFQWRVNGGAWTTGVNFSTAGVSLGFLTVYTLLSDGFKTGDVFRWDRSDRVADLLAVSDIQDLLQYKQSVYYINADYRVMELHQYDGARYYAITAGYEAMYGKKLAIFEDHLFIMGGGSHLTIDDKAVISNSDLGDLNAFYSTDVNEADTFTVPVNTTFPFAKNELTGIGIVNTRLFLTTESAIWYTDYAGLPTPFSYHRLRDFPGIVKVLTGLDCLYFYTANGRIYRFDGTNISTYGANYFPLLTSSSDIHQVTIDRQNLLQYFFDKGTKTLLANDHSRSVDLASGAPACVSNLGDGLYVGTANLKVLHEDREYTHTPVLVADAPYLITQPIVGQGVYVTKDLDGIFLGVDLSSTPGAAYALDDDVRVSLDFYKPDTGIPVTLIPGGVWASGNLQHFGAVRTSFKSLLIKLSLFSNSARPPGGVTLTSLTVAATNLNKTEAVKQ